MAEDLVNQEQFKDDVLAAAAANDGESFVDPNSMGSDYKMPSAEEIWKMVQEMDGISDEEKETLRENLFNPQSTTEEFLKRYASMGHSNAEYLTFIAMIVLISLVFALFGYKLYKSLKEKERKRQEKLKNKQSKKTKKSN